MVATRVKPGFSLVAVTRLFLFFFLVSIWGLSWSTYLAADDHGNDPATATSIKTDGTPLAGNIETPGDVDYFKFLGTLGRLYRVETFELGPNSDTFIVLYAPDGITKLFEDDQSGSEENASKITRGDESQHVEGTTTTSQLAMVFRI